MHRASYQTIVEATNLIGKRYVRREIMSREARL